MLLAIQSVAAASSTAVHENVVNRGHMSLELAARPYDDWLSPGPHPGPPAVRGVEESGEAGS